MSGASGAATRPYLGLRLASLAPVVLTCEHATCRLPSRGRLRRDERRVLATHWGWDIGAWRLTTELSRGLATSAIGGRWSRLLVDLNRRVDDPTLIRAQAAGVALSWNASVDARERERRVLAYHAPYHEAVDRLILRRLIRGVRPLLFAVHTFTPRFDGRRRDFDAGVLYERDVGAARRLARALRKAGLSVRYNRPYSGMAGMMYSVDRHGKHHRLPCLELELNQELFAAAGAARKLAPIVVAGIRDVLSGVRPDRALRGPSRGVSG